MVEKWILLLLSSLHMSILCTITIESEKAIKPVLFDSAFGVLISGSYSRVQPSVYSIQTYRTWQENDQNTTHR